MSNPRTASRKNRDSELGTWGLVLARVRSATPHVVLNWFEELNERVPTGQ